MDEAPAEGLQALVRVTDRDEERVFAALKPGLDLHEWLMTEDGYDTEGAANTIGELWAAERLLYQLRAGRAIATNGGHTPGVTS